MTGVEASSLKDKRSAVSYSQCCIQIKLYRGNVHSGHYREPTMYFSSGSSNFLTSDKAAMLVSNLFKSNKL